MLFFKNNLINLKKKRLDWNIAWANWPAWRTWRRVAYYRAWYRRNLWRDTPISSSMKCTKEMKTRTCYWWWFANSCWRRERPSKWFWCLQQPMPANSHSIFELPPPMVSTTLLLLRWRRENLFLSVSTTLMISYSMRYSHL